MFYSLFFCFLNSIQYWDGGLIPNRAGYYMTLRYAEKMDEKEPWKIKFQAGENKGFFLSVKGMEKKEVLYTYLDCCIEGFLVWILSFLSFFQNFSEFTRLSS